MPAYGTGVTVVINQVGGDAAIPSNAILDENGTPILDEDGNIVVSE